MPNRPDKLNKLASGSFSRWWSESKEASPVFGFFVSVLRRCWVLARYRGEAYLHLKYSTLPGTQSWIDRLAANTVRRELKDVMIALYIKNSLTITVTLETIERRALLSGLAQIYSFSEAERVALNNDLRGTKLCHHLAKSRTPWYRSMRRRASRQ
jgi:hypothetical protein